MKVILRADVANVGYKGDVCDVSDGFARNYLVPKGLAMRATNGAAAQAQAMRRSRDLREARDREAAEEVARRLVAAVVRITARAGAEGRLFGSVTAHDLADAVQEQFHVGLDRRKIQLPEPLKTLGLHTVQVKLHTDVEFSLNVEVVAATA